MKYRITLADCIYHECEELADAQSEALDHARELTRACGFAVTVRVHRLSHRVLDNLSRDVTPAFFVGSAVGRVEHSNSFVSWVPAPRTAAMPVKRRVAA